MSLNVSRYFLVQISQPTNFFIFLKELFFMLFQGLVFIVVKYAILLYFMLNHCQLLLIIQDYFLFLDTLLGHLL